MIVLPVDFVNVFAQQSRDKKYIFWQVAAESNVKEYVVERSAGGTDGFAAIGNVTATANGAGVKQYQYLDNYSSETAFYRIRAVDNDGRFKYSSIIRVTGNAADTKLTLLNNGGNVSFLLFSADAGDLVIRVADQNGRLVHNSIVHGAQGMNRYSIDNFSTRPRGIYFVHITGQDGAIYTSKFSN
jgi:hypothetical protein